MTSDKLLLIDTEILLYQKLLATMNERCDAAGCYYWASSPDEAKLAFDDAMAHICASLGTRSFILAFSDRFRSLRREIYPRYKANRKATDKVPGLSALVRLIQDKYRKYIAILPGLEADDVLGIYATRPDSRQKIIISTDKDLLGVPGLIYRSFTDFHEAPLVTDTLSANRHHALQALTGDSTDGYGGCPNMGEKTALALLEKAEQEQEGPENTYPWWPTIVEAYAKKGLGEEYALTQARLAWIGRFANYNFKTQNYIHWTPPQA